MPKDIYTVKVTIERVAGASGKAVFGSHLYEVELSPKKIAADVGIQRAVKAALAKIK